MKKFIISFVFLLCSICQGATNDLDDVLREFQTLNQEIKTLNDSARIMLENSNTTVSNQQGNAETLTQLDDRLFTMATALNQVNSRVNDIKGFVRTIKTDTATIKDTANKINTTINSIKLVLDNMSNNLLTLQEIMTSISESITLVHQTALSILESIDYIKLQIDSVLDYLSTFQIILENILDNQSIIIGLINKIINEGIEIDWETLNKTLSVTLDASTLSVAGDVSIANLPEDLEYDYEPVLWSIDQKLYDINDKLSSTLDGGYDFMFGSYTSWLFPRHGDFWLYAYKGEGFEQESVNINLEGPYLQTLTHIAAEQLTLLNNMNTVNLAILMNLITNVAYGVENANEDAEKIKDGLAGQLSESEQISNYIKFMDLNSFLATRDYILDAIPHNARLPESITLNFRNLQFMDFNISLCQLNLDLSDTRLRTLFLSIRYLTCLGWWLFSLFLIVCFFRFFINCIFKFFVWFSSVTSK